MKVAVVGAGSIGIRHQIILKELGYQVRVVSSKASDAEFRSLDDALTKEFFDYVVIASETSRHFVDLSTLISRNFAGRVLIEKPLFEKSHQIAAQNFRFLAVGYNLRFHPAVKWFKETKAKLGKISSANFYVGQYLPTWRPEIDYKKSSSAVDISGGGVLRDLSHELDLARNMFGDWQCLTALGGKFSNLEISTDDTFSILMKTNQCPVMSIQLNYLDRIKQRYVTVNGDNGTINIDLVSNKARFNESEVDFEVETNDTYIAQHQAIISCDLSNICTFDEAFNVVKTIEAIELSTKSAQWISK